MAQNSKEETSQYIQPTLAGTEIGAEAEPVEETELENCLVLSRPRYQPATKKRPEHWVVRVHAQPTMFQPEMDTVFFATADSSQAVTLNKQSLRPGDRARVRGVLSPQAIPLNNGQAIQQISITDMQVLSRVQRVSTTVFEQKQHR